MDEVTHEMWKDGQCKHGYSTKNSKVHIGHQYWSHAQFDIAELKRLGWEVRPVHVELENK